MKRTHIRDGVRRLFRLRTARAERIAAEMAEEIESHLAQRADELIALGYSPAEARREAERRFGDVAIAGARLATSAQRRERILNGREWLSSVRQDLGVGVRKLVAEPTFALIAVVLLALGVGANATVYSWLHGLVLEPLPLVKDVGSLVAIRSTTPSGVASSVSFPDYLDWSGASRSLSAVVAYRRQQLSVQGQSNGQAEAIWGVMASSNYFDALGVSLVRGRGFRPEESAPLAPAGTALVAVIGYDLWQRQFAGRDDVVGQPIWINGHRLTIIGVAPQGFAGSNVGFAFELWAPITLQPTLLGEPAAKLTWRNSRWLTAFARLRPSATLAQANAELKTIGARLARDYPEDRHVEPTASQLLDAEASAFLEPVLAILLGATALMLLVVAFNLAGLLLVRAAARRMELGIRVALGASRTRIVQQFVIESLLLATVATPAALLVAYQSQGLLNHFLTHSTFPLATPPRVTTSVIAFAAAVMALLILVVSVWPATRAVRDGRNPLTLGANRSVTSRGRGRETLVAIQLGLSLVTVGAAAMLVSTLVQLRRSDTGLVDPAHTLLVSSDFDLAGPGYAGFGDDPLVRARRIPLAREMLQRVRALPGVRDAVLMDNAPLGLISGYDAFDVAVPGHVPRQGENLSFEMAVVSPGYLETVGPQLVRGRGFTDADGIDGPTVILVNEAFARQFWPATKGTEPAVGKIVNLGGRHASVIGVVRNAKYHALTDDARPFMYLAYNQWVPSTLTVAIRTAGDPLTLAGPVRAAFRDVAPGLPIIDPRTLEDQVDGALTLQRVSATLLAALGALALLVATVGLYGSLAQAVQQRRREIGIRMTLGARASDILRQFVWRGMTITLFGIALGAPLLYLVARWLRHALAGVGAPEPIALASIALLLALTAGTATVVTALRAARTNPALTTRGE